MTFRRQRPADVEPVNTDSSGGTRYSEGKPQYWNMPLLGLAEIARAAEHGSQKYAPFDYRQGQSFTTLLNCTLSHVLKATWCGIWARDEESGVYHLAHAGWNILCLLSFMHEGRHDLDDITPIMHLTAAEYRARNAEMIGDV